MGHNNVKGEGFDNYTLHFKGERRIVKKQPGGTDKRSTFLVHEDHPLMDGEQQVKVVVATYNVSHAHWEITEVPRGK